MVLIFIRVLKRKQLHIQIEHNSAFKRHMVGSSALEKWTLKLNALFVKNHNAFSMPIFDKSKTLKKKKSQAIQLHYLVPLPRKQ